MEKYSTQQISQFKELYKQIEARLPITKIVALTKKSIRKQTSKQSNSRASTAASESDVFQYIPLEE